MLRKKGVVGKFVEFYGTGLSALPVADRTTIGNMSPEYGSTVAIFPIDDRTLEYLRLTGRSAEQIALVEAYAKAQGMFRTDASPDPRVHRRRSNSISSTVEPNLAGPRRPQDRVPLQRREAIVRRRAGRVAGRARRRRPGDVALREAKAAAERHDRRKPAEDVADGAVVIAAITTCTNTSNPAVLIGAGLLAKNAVERGLKTQPWVKTSLAPGSKVVTDYLAKAGLQAVSRRARLQPRRLRLHDVHRQQRSAARRRRRNGRRARPDRRRGALGQSQLRRPHPSASARELSGVAAAGRRVRAGRPHGHRSHDRAARHGQRRQAGLS